MGCTKSILSDFNGCLIEFVWGERSRHFLSETQIMATEYSITVVVITSPCPSMPSTALVDSTLNSLECLSGIRRYVKQTLILMDGYKTAAENRFKKGRISDSDAKRYDEYESNIRTSYGSRPDYFVHRSPQHLGFAMMVKWGLELCSTKFALLLQHDRYFCFPFHRIEAVLQSFDDVPYIRYVGFPTNNSHKHDLLLRSTYKAEFLTERERLVIDSDLALQPLIFWFDSQHIAHVQRYLEIFEPNRHFPEHLKTMTQKGQINAMVLRRGDFIEDRFGQAQRNLFAHFQKEGRSPEDVSSLFRWFGSFLCWQLEDCTRDIEGPAAHVMVSHMHGRSLNLEFLDSIAAKYGFNRVASHHRRRLIESAANDEDRTAGMVGFTQRREERRRQQLEIVRSLVDEAGDLKEDSEALEEAMQFLSFNAEDSGCCENDATVDSQWGMK